MKIKMDELKLDVVDLPDNIVIRFARSFDDVSRTTLGYIMQHVKEKPDTRFKNLIYPFFYTVNYYHGKRYLVHINESHDINGADGINTDYIIMLNATYSYTVNTSKYIEICRFTHRNWYSMKNQYIKVFKRIEQ